MRPLGSDWIRRSACPQSLFRPLWRHAVVCPSSDHHRFNTAPSRALLTSFCSLQSAVWMPFHYRRTSVVLVVKY